MQNLSFRATYNNFLVIELEKNYLIIGISLKITERIFTLIRMCCHCIDFLAQNHNRYPFTLSDYSTQQLSANDGPADPFGPSNGGSGSGGTGVGGGGGGYEDVLSKGSSEGGYSNPSLYTNSAPRSSSKPFSFITALLGIYFRVFN